MLLTLSVSRADAVIPPVSWDFQTAPEDITIVNNEEGSPTFEYVDWRKNLVYEASYGDSPASEMLVLPLVQLKAGKTYELSYSAYASWYRFDWNPSLRWLIATAPELLPEGKPIGESVTFTSSYNPGTYSLTFEVAADGTYSIGALFSADEAQGSASFYLSSISLDGGISANAPVAPGLSVTPVIRDGSLAIDIQLAAPDKTISGSDITGTLTYTVANATGRFSQTGDILPGETKVLADDGCDNAGESYTAYVTSGGDTGQTVTVRCVPEYDRPSAPENVRISRQENGVILIEWDPVTEGISGGLFNPSTVVYSVQRSDRTSVATKIQGTSVTDSPTIPEEGQSAYRYTVSAYGNAESYTSSSAVSDEILIGNPYQGGLTESFDNGSAGTSAWSFGPASATSSAWSASTSSYSNPECNKDSDGTGGFLLFNPSYSDGMEYRSPLIDMTGCTDPRLSMDIYRYSTAPAEALVELWVESDGIRTAIDNGNLCLNAENDGWATLGFSLPQCVSEKPFRLVLAGTKVNGQAYKAIIDRICIRDVKKKDATLESADVVTGLMPGQTVDVSASVMNTGSESLEGVFVTVSIDSEDTGETTPFSLWSGQKKLLSIPVYISPFLADQDHVVTVTVHADGDLDTSDNSIAVPVAVGKHPLPYAIPLSAEHTDDGALVRWSAPEVPSEPVGTAVTESFEDWDTGNTEAVEDWIFIDSDGKDKNGLAGVNVDQKFAFFVADKFSTSAASTFTAADGAKALVTTRASDYSETDVWLISPCIDPAAEISFQATGIGFRGADTASFELGYLPDNSTDISAFVKTEDIETSGYSWETVSTLLPADAGRFAIHIVNVQTYGVAFDDFRFKAISEPPVLDSYKIWRNRQLVATLTPEHTSWTDPDADKTTDNHYHISCVYMPDKEVMDNEGIMLKANSMPGSVEGIVRETGWELRRNTLEAHGKVAVYTIQGIKVAEADTSGSIILEPGIYMVKGNESIDKIIVR